MRRTRSPWSSERFRSTLIARLVLALFLLSGSVSCAIWRKPDPVPQMARVVCPKKLTNEPCPRPVYVFPPGLLGADLAAAVAITESRARDSCSDQVDGLQGCIEKHNSKAGKPQRK